MAKQTPILRKTATADAAILQANTNCCYCMSGTNAGNVALPVASIINGALATSVAQVDQLGTKFFGVPDVISDANLVAEFTTDGIVQIQSDGSGGITAGQDVIIANTSGQIKAWTVSAPGSPGTQANWVGRQLIGTALNTVAATSGNLCDVQIDRRSYPGG